LSDDNDLAHVAQFLAVNERNPMYPKELLRSYYESMPPGDFSDANEPHAILARLPLPVYVTTNYDESMLTALRSIGPPKKNPKWEIYRWNQELLNETSQLRAGFNPTATSPLMFYLHGHFSLTQSLVLTEDDYLEFLVNSVQEIYSLPALILGNLSKFSLLFVGYRLTDWNFRIWLHLLKRITNMRGTSVTAVLPPDQASLRAEQASAQAYLEDYFKEIRLTVFWGEANAFLEELNDRWNNSSYYRPPVIQPGPEINTIILRDRMLQRMKVSEIEVLCFDIREALRRNQIEYPLDLEVVGGTDRENIVVNLITYLENRGNLSYLVDALEKRRPDLFEPEDRVPGV
jgi:hypothetical protein